MNYPLLFIVGPTASGKTDVAVELARAINANIVSCDSMLVYKEPKILVNKPDAKILGRIKHYMIDIISVEEDFDVYRFKKEVDHIINANYPKKNLIFAGGSGLYVKVILDGIFDEPAGSRQLRDRFLKEAKDKGAKFLYSKLKEVDPQACVQIKSNDLRRIIRALEVYELSKKPISLRQKEAEGYWQKIPIKIFGLWPDKKILYQKIDLRTNRMFEMGAVDEVRELNKFNLSRTAKKILGIKEINDFLSGNCSQNQAKDELSKNTRRFAKRQYTWFKKDARINWVRTEQKTTQEIAAQILKESLA